MPRCLIPWLAGAPRRMERGNLLDKQGAVQADHTFQKQNVAQPIEIASGAHSGVPNNPSHARKM